ncbi:hypothetical protein GLOTRDRAFT_141571 [Gloeophyllum trabeum ATCC 11539]|uniref:F-box domain-containing protein n=1 Tax=Gloeophyllum trabeum (strain ATCC 11539 / FP-39264 / Madison 617) TaxID=670483 RepID=S7RCX3_GLOTA|nr:uncharacterized protein GLOTRDRAFT_141571 [Gloeophyllum trabeum ATCC 11539]EPQ50264.1 hypothetical protein GLOTRDRAFT_141571 [Gloeophyllum trabeum ATCC 11539]
MDFQVSKFFMDLIDTSPLLTYMIELAKHGMENGPSTRISIPARLQRLRTHAEAWKTLNFESVEELSMSAMDDWELTDGVLARGYGPHMLQFNELPGHSRGIPAAAWVLRFEFPVRNFRMDPSQDLLILIEFPESNGAAPPAPCKIHIRTLSEGTPHPLARNPEIVILLQYYYSEDCISHLLICGDKFGYMSEYERPEEEPGDDIDLFAYNWRTSESLLHMYAVNQPLETFAFLSDQYILLVVAEGSRPRLEVYDLSTTSSARTEWTGQDYLCAFTYAPISTNDSINIAIQSAPSPSWSSSPSPSSGSNVPFHSARSTRVLAVSYEYMNPSPQAPPQEECHGVVNLVPYVHLLDMLPTRAEGAGTTWLWDAWGAARTFVLAEMTPDMWSACVHGSRYVHLAVVSGQDRVVAEILDFRAMAAAARSFRISPSPSSEDVPHARPDDGWMYAAYGVTVSTTKEDDNDRCVMISEDSLVIMEEKEDGGRTFRVCSL